MLALAQLEIVALRKWEEFAQLICGAWLIVSPFILDYAHQDHLRYWHWVLGGTESVLAAFEIWQDRFTVDGVLPAEALQSTPWPGRSPLLQLTSMHQKDGYAGGLDCGFRAPTKDGFAQWAVTVSPHDHEVGLLFVGDVKKNLAY